MSTRPISTWAAMAAFAALIAAVCSPAMACTPQEGGVRAPVDSVGYAIYPAQVEAVVAVADSISAARGESEEVPPGAMIGGICPHDDYIYAGTGYVRLLRHVKAPLVVLVGVSHYARRAGIGGKLIFEDFCCWSAPYGRVKVSGLREEIEKALPADLVMVSDSLHAKEHSLEGLVPFLQYPWQSGDKGGKKAEAEKTDSENEGGLEILPVLVTYLPGEKMSRAAEAFAKALHSLAASRGMVLGRDYVIIISSDCVHYGDVDWGGRNYAPFGADSTGYRRAVARDRKIAGEVLSGTISGSNVARFRDLVDSGEFQQPYKISWCGVYSIPFGVDVLVRLCALEGRKPPSGVLLEYGTSLDPGRLPLERAGLGPTAIATIRHWVGYTAIGYW